MKLSTMHLAVLIFRDGQRTTVSLPSLPEEILFPAPEETGPIVLQLRESYAGSPAIYEEK